MILKWELLGRRLRELAQAKRFGGLLGSCGRSSCSGVAESGRRRSFLSNKKIFAGFFPVEQLAREISSAGARRENRSRRADKLPFRPAGHAGRRGDWRRDKGEDGHPRVTYLAAPAARAAGGVLGRATRTARACAPPRRALRGRALCAVRQWTMLARGQGRKIA